MSTLNEKPKLDKSNIRMRELAALAPDEGVVPVGLDILLVRRMLVDPNKKHNCFDLGREIRKDKCTTATDYNIKKAFRYLIENGVVDSHPVNLYSLTPEIKELILEVNVKNVKNRQKR